MAFINALDIVTPGPLTTVQDLGRTGYGAFGVPPSGAVDPFSLSIGNLLVGNRENAAGLEITLTGLKVRALTPMVVAVTGGDLHPLHNNQPLTMWRATRMTPGDVLSFGLAKTGCRAYLTIGGGIQVPDVMESAATNLGSGFGGLDGRALRGGDILAADAPERHLDCAGQKLDRDKHPVYAAEWRLRVIYGPQDGDFPHAAKTRFTGDTFTVTADSDRTGIRLEGPSLAANQDLPSSIISEGVIPGAIQVPGSGQPIILLGETVTGGYRKIATVISADLSLLGQIKPAHRVTFEPVTLPEAHKALEAHTLVKAVLQKQLNHLP